MSSAFDAIAGKPRNTRKEEKTQESAVFTPVKKQKVKEIRNQRLQLVVKPSLGALIKSDAKAADMSVNEFLNQIIIHHYEVQGRYEDS